MGNTCLLGAFQWCKKSSVGASAVSSLCPFKKGEWRWQFTRGNFSSCGGGDDDDDEYDGDVVATITFRPGGVEWNCHPARNSHKE